MDLQPSPRTKVSALPVWNYWGHSARYRWWVIKGSVRCFPYPPYAFHHLGVVQGKSVRKRSVCCWKSWTKVPPLPCDCFSLLLTRCWGSSSPHALPPNASPSHCTVVFPVCPEVWGEPRTCPFHAHFTFSSSVLSWDSFLSVFSQIFLHQIGPNE